MFNSAFLDTIVAAAVIFAFASAVCSALFESFSSLVGLRGLLLKKTIQAMLGQHAQGVISHAALKGLYAGLWGFPSYIDPQLFGEILYSTAGVSTDSNPPTTKITLLDPFFATASSPSGVVQNLAAWFIACSDRTTGVYRRWAQVGLALVALPFCIAVPIDAIAVVKTLYANAAFRDRLLASAVAGCLKDIELGTFVFQSEGYIGIVLATYCISFGAPFWFDLARNLLRINPRQTGPASDSVLSGQ